MDYKAEQFPLANLKRRFGCSDVW